MPLGQKPLCSRCSSGETLVWHKGPEDEVLCHECFLPQVPAACVVEDAEMPEQVAQDIEVMLTEDKTDERPESEEATEEKQPLETRSGGSSRTVGRTLKKLGRGRAKKSVASKGKGRRTIFKKQPTKAPASIPVVVTNKSLMYNGVYYQVGDIVSVLDEDSGIFYAQIRGLLQDQYCEKSAVLTWLLPTQSSPPPEKSFDPATYIIGPEEEIPRKLEYLEFVMHSPSEYYRLNIDAGAPFGEDTGYVWTTMGPVKRVLAS